LEYLALVHTTSTSAASTAGWLISSGRSTSASPDSLPAYVRLCATSTLPTQFVSSTRTTTRSPSATEHELDSADCKSELCITSDVELGFKKPRFLKT